MHITDRRGPQISNGTVERAAMRRLAKTGYPALKGIECAYWDGTMVLRGRVPSYFHKQLAQEALRSIHDVKQLVNKIQVP
jgi:hypothetical protein